MSKVVGHAPLLLTLLMGNNNLNHQAMAGTTVVQEQVVEADYLRGKHTSILRMIDCDNWFEINKFEAFCAAIQITDPLLCFGIFCPLLLNTDLS